MRGYLQLALRGYCSFTFRDSTRREKDQMALTLARRLSFLSTAQTKNLFLSLGFSREVW